MTQHPILPFWLELMRLGHLRYADVCSASNVRVEVFSRWVSGAKWPNKRSVQKINSGLGALLGLPVGKGVDTLWVTGGAVSAKLFGPQDGLLCPQLVPIFIPKRNRRLASPVAKKVELSPSHQLK